MIFTDRVSRVGNDLYKKSIIFYPSAHSFVSSTYTGITQARTGDQSASATPSYASQVTDDGLQRTITTPVSAGISPYDDGITPPLRALQLSSGATHGWQFTRKHPQI
ncbi:hypothetical protein [uncultured Psychrobacter sp.]|uniref:hypothetical protein n=1 Tax=uncultured Psychrobacter sp. TaxID=259303 RepID=UPI0025973877|nr:hypothetical protein [uncultured Psychrobacter sp.]